MDHLKKIYSFVHCNICQIALYSKNENKNKETNIQSHYLP